MNIRLGDYDPTLPPKTTPLGITYYPYGIDDYGPKRVRKAIRKMRLASVAEYIIAEFEPFALALPDELANWIDTAYVRRMNDWRLCVGSRLPNGRMITDEKLDTLTPSKIRIIFHAEPLVISTGEEVASAAWVDRIESVMAYLSNENSWLRRADKLVEYEIGNWIGIQFSYYPHDTANEIGHRKPCL